MISEQGTGAIFICKFELTIVLLHPNLIRADCVPFFM